MDSDPPFGLATGDLDRGLRSCGRDFRGQRHWSILEEEQNWQLYKIKNLDRCRWTEIWPGTTQMWAESGSMAGERRDWLAETCSPELVADLGFFGDRKEWLFEKTGQFYLFFIKFLIWKKAYWLEWRKIRTCSGTMKKENSVFLIYLQMYKAIFIIQC